MIIQRRRISYGPVATDIEISRSGSSTCTNVAQRNIAAEADTAKHRKRSIGSRRAIVHIESRAIVYCERPSYLIGCIGRIIIVVKSSIRADLNIIWIACICSIDSCRIECPLCAPLLSWESSDTGIILQQGFNSIFRAVGHD